MTTLLHRSSIRYLLHHRLQLVLAILGIALGVAVVVAIDIANGSAQRAFELSSDAVIGKATHQIVEVSGRVPDRIYRQLRLDLKVRTVAPVVESDFTIPGSDIEVLTLLGVDPFAEGEFRTYLSTSSGAELDLASFLLTPGAVLLEPVTADRLGVDKGESFLARLPNREVRLQLVGYLQPKDDLTRDAISNLAVVDIATAQEALGLVGRLSRIDLILPAGRAGVLELESIREALPPGIEVRESSSNRDIADQMTRAFRLNLQALSLLALFCGAFLIYNTMTFAVVQRRSLIAVLRAIGTTRRQILSMILIEAVVLGIVGTVVGQAAGVALGRVLVGLVTQTINDLYFVVSVRSIAIEPWTLVKGAAIGLGTTLAAALAPALEATSTPPRRALETIELERRTRGAVPAVTFLGVLLLGLGYLLIAASGQRLLPAFVGLFAFLMGSTALTPIFTLGLMAVLTPLAGLAAGQLGRLATRGVSTMLSRTGIAVAALMMALAVTVGVDLMIRSFRDTVEDWLEYSLPADLYVSSFVSPARRFTAGPTFEPETIASLAEIDGIAAINTLRHFEAIVDGERARAMAMSVAPQSRSAFLFLEADADAVWSRLDAEEGVIISEALAYRRGLQRGQNVTIESPSGSLELEVSGVFFDYSSEQGVLMMPHSLYRRLWDDPSLTAISVHLSSPADADRVKAEIVSRLDKATTARVVSNRDLRDQSMRVFDRTFKITGVLKTLAVLVAFIGVLSSLMALQLERAREQGVLLAQGMTPRQLWRLIFQQTGLMGLTAGLLSLPVGLAIAMIMVTVINRRSFGWTLELQVASTPLLQTLLVGLSAALLAGLYPAWKMSRTSLPEALRNE